MKVLKYVLFVILFIMLLVLYFCAYRSINILSPLGNSKFMFRIVSAIFIIFLSIQLIFALMKYLKNKTEWKSALVFLITLIVIAIMNLMIHNSNTIVIKTGTKITITGIYYQGSKGTQGIVDGVFIKWPKETPDTEIEKYVGKKVEIIGFYDLEADKEKEYKKLLKEGYIGQWSSAPEMTVESIKIIE